MDPNHKLATPFLTLISDKLALILGRDASVIVLEIDLALRAMANDWTAQEIVNCIIAWRRKHGYPFLEEKQHYDRILNICAKLLKLPVPDEAELSFVYFVEAVGTNLIKIGKASNPEKRLKQLQTSSPHPLRIMFLIPGGHNVETELHEQFRHLRGEGEWFRASSEIISFVEERRKLSSEFIELLFVEN